MLLEMNQHQRDLMLDLVKSRISELGPEIRRCRVSTYHDRLQRDLKVMRELLAQLEASHAAPAY